MNIAKKIWSKLPSDFSVVTIFSLISKAIQAILTIVIIRALTVEDYATYTVFLTLSTTILGVAGQSFSLAYVRYNTEKISIDSKAADTVFVVSHLINVVSCAFVGIVLAIVGDGFGYASYVLLLALLYGFLLGAIQVNIAFHQSRESYVVAGILDNCKQASILIFVVTAIVVFSSTIDSMIVAYLLSGFFCFVVSLGLFVKPMRERTLRFVLDTAEAKAFIATSVWLILYNAVMQTFNQIDVSILSALGTVEQVAEYGVALKYFNIIMILLPSIKTVLRVRMSKAEMTSNVAKQKEFSIKWIKKTTLPFLVAVVAMCGLAQIFFPVLNGAQYDSAIYVFDILCVCAFFAYILAPSVSLVMSLGKYKEQFLLSLAALVINVAGDWFLTPGFGAAGVAMATTISQFALNASMTVLVFYEAGKAEKMNGDIKW